MQVKLTITVTLYQPLAFGSEDLELVITGGVLSMLTLPTVTDAEFPALSMQVPVDASFWPSAERIEGLDAESTPDKVSVQVKLMVTLPLFQPLELGEGDAVPVMVGAVRSMLILLDVVEAEFPATSRHVPVTD